jgi:hypothetical protein
MNGAWNRARINAHTHNSASEEAYPVLVGGAAIRKEVTESFQGFSFMLQRENLQFDEETLKNEGFAFVFKGDRDVAHGDDCDGQVCYKRKPGAWWGARKKVLNCCRGVRFIDDVERQAKKIMDNITKWHVDGRGGSKILGVHETKAGEEGWSLDGWDFVDGSDVG